MLITIIVGSINTSTNIAIAVLKMFVMIAILIFLVFIIHPIVKKRQNSISIAIILFISRLFIMYSSSL